jgi:hypothetical protein
MTSWADENLALTDEEVDLVAHRLCAAGWDNDLMFQSRVNRDAVYHRAKQLGAVMKRSRTGNSVLDPRYTVEGRNLPDRGLANDTIVGNFYKLERTL